MVCFWLLSLELEEGKIMQLRDWKRERNSWARAQVSHWALQTRVRQDIDRVLRGYVSVTVGPNGNV